MPWAVVGLWVAALVLLGPLAGKFSGAQQNRAVDYLPAGADSTQGGAGHGGPRLPLRPGAEVLTLVARGLNNTEIAETLGLSPLTAKTHVSRTMGKLGARDRAQLVVVAYESGLVAPGAG
ncbi:hypothetical protein GCM10009536_04140 [Streptomyces thermocarboxydus]|uniref:DNA-binding CsgD family transcriptional regulator n=1 Tax=Streptomyces thermodiastaticus TaxID=44061 RepID=A0ABU0KLN5_9ACTN|nr:DNA-binding CsgD family transcriptional regulator [Streptomyces thermodiastaticus]